MIKILEINLTSHLTTDALQIAFTRIQPELEQNQEKIPLLVNCLDMTSYDDAARILFTEWNRKWRHKISKIAVLTDKTLWHLIIAAMGIASGQKIKPYSDENTAKQWLINN